MVYPSALSYAPHVTASTAVPRRRASISYFSSKINVGRKMVCWLTLPASNHDGAGMRPSWTAFQQAVLRAAHELTVIPSGLPRTHNSLPAAIAEAIAQGFSPQNDR